MRKILWLSILALILACDLTGPMGPPGESGADGIPGGIDTLYIHNTDTVYVSETDTLLISTTDTVYIANEDGREIVWLTPEDILGESGEMRYFDISYAMFKIRRASPILAQLYWSTEKWAWVEWPARTSEDPTSIFYQKLGVAETGRFRMAYFYWDVL